MNILRTRTFAAIALLISSGFSSGVARAGVTFFDVFKSSFHQQVSDAQPIDPFGYRFDSRVFFENPSDFSSVTTTYAGPFSPLNYVVAPGSNFRYSSTFNAPLFPTKSELDANFPNGVSYNFHIAGGTLGSQTAVLNAPSVTFYPAEIPFLTGSTFSQLQGLNPTAPFTINWNGFTPVAGANQAFIFFSIFRASDLALVFDRSFLSSNQTSVLLPANTLNPATKYSYELVYSSRLSTPDAGFDGATGIVAFDRRTSGTFTTVVPEPTSALTLSTGVIIVGLISFSRCRVAGGKATQPRPASRPGE